MPRLCFVQHASEWPLYESIARALSEDGVESIMVCKTRGAQRHYKQQGYETLFVEEAFTGISKTDDELVALEERYRSPGLRLILDSDVQLQRLFRNERERLNVIARTLEFWERVYDKQEVDAVLARESATFLSRTAYVVARTRGIPFGQLAIGPGNDQFTIDDVDESHVWSSLIREIKSEPRDLTPDERARVEAFVQGKIAPSTGPMRLRFVPKSPISSTKSYLGMLLRDTSALERQDPVRAGALRYGRYRTLKQFVWQYITRFFFTYDEPQAEDAYVYFPFYSGQETSYLVSDRFWSAHEVELLIETARCLPYGHLLYVKEHPTNPGDLTYPQLRRLRKVPNIRVIHPSYSSQALIKGSRAVCVLQGTSGWEAFLSKKPVVALSRPFFAYSSLVYRVSDIAELASILQRALAQGEAVYETKDWEWFIYIAISTAYEGVVLRVEPPYGFPDDPENGRRIAAAVKETLLSAGGKRGIS